jgi:NADH-quinone oxidoreductase chain G
MITITINGKEIKLEKAVTILEAAKMHGIHIPHFCRHPILELWGGCRMCLVEVEKMPRLQAACTLYVADGMVIRTETDAISKARKGVLELLLSQHPLDCPVCDKAGECKLQDYTTLYGPAVGRFFDEKRKHPESLKDPLIVRNMERCILCTRCVRMCSGVQGANAITITGRGRHSFMEPFSGGRYDCEYCGNCLTVCPVGAIMSKLHRYAYRTWQIDRKVETLCSYCGVGCTMTLEVRDEEIKRVVPKMGVGTNNGILCNRGRFGYEYVGSPERLKTPLIRKNGKLAPATWEEAIETVSGRLTAIKNSSGGKAIAGIAGARCTNEENYVFQKLLRGLQSNNIDSIARMGFAGGQRLIEGLLGSGATANAISGIANSDAVITLGGDPTRINPVFGINIRAAFNKGAKLITIGHAPGLKWHCTVGVQPVPRTEGILLGGLIAELLKHKTLKGENKPLEEKIRDLKLPSLDDAEKACRCPKKDMEGIVLALKDKESVSIVIGREIAKQTEGAALSAILAYILNARLYMLSERPNEQGLVDMGCLPDMLPGQRPVDIPSFRKRYEEVWAQEVPSEKGLTLMEMMEAASGGSIKAMYVMGENPAFNLPDSGYVRNALEKLEFLVVQDIFMTETAEMAHVVLPALGWAEKEGTYTNLERRIQLLKKAVNKPEMEDWRIISEIGRKIGLKMHYDSAEDIMKEIAEVSPTHAGLTYKDIEKGSYIWPYKGKPLTVDFEFPALKHAESAVSGDTFFLNIEKPLFHSGTLSRRSPALNSIYPEALLRLNPETAVAHSLKDGDTAKVSTEKGSLSLKVKTDPDVPPSALFLTNTFEGKGVMGLLGYGIEPNTKAPIIRYKGIRIEKES